MYVPTAAEVSRVLCYVPETGQFLRLISSGGIKAGTEAGWINGEGYRYVRINYRIYPAHRVAWLLMTGEWPKKLIDHVDGCQSNNRWSNLREASYTQNSANSHTPRSNLTGFSGVKQAGRKYYATIMKDYKSVWLGIWATAQEASDAYNRAGKALHGEFWHR